MKQEHPLQFNFTVMGMSILFLLLGALLLFFPNISVSQVCYALCGVVVALGILYIAQYFITESYKDLQQYGFSIGVLLIILGICGFIRINELISAFYFFIGMMFLIAGILHFQNALDFKILKQKSYVLWIAVAITVLLCGTMVILNPFPEDTTLATFTNYSLIIVGLFTLIGNLFLFFTLKRLQKKAAKEASENNPITEDPSEDTQPEIITESQDIEDEE